MARLQITISDEVAEILSRIDCNMNRRLFIEYAIKSAVKNKEICEIFGLQDLSLALAIKAKDPAINTIAISKVNQIKSVSDKSKFVIDDEFNDE